MTARFSQARIDLEAKAVRLARFAGPDDSSTSVDRELATGPSAGGDVLPDPTPILETAQRLAELVAIRDRAR